MNEEPETEDDLRCACGVLVIGPLMGMFLWAALWAVI
jgi:hypothetical protein